MLWKPTVDLNVIGLGYVGLPTAVAFAQAGLRVAGTDVNCTRVDAVNRGRTGLSEPGLDEALAAVVRGGGLSATTQPVAAEAYVIAVPTPLGPAKQPDLSHLWSAADALAPVLAPGALLILESTVPPGATEALADRLAALRPDLVLPPAAGAAPVRIAHCPERVLPGRILTELRENDRIIGGLTRDCAAAADRLFARAFEGERHLTDARTAEVAKLAENAYRDVNIAFANELGRICESLEIDARAMIRLANRHPRVDILSPGPGVGGHCIAVDPWFLAAAAPDRARLIRTARAVNDARPAQVAAEASAMVEDLAAPLIACFGLAYKADVGDLRESPALEVCRLLAGLRRGRVLAVEPNLEGGCPDLDGVEFVGASSALAQADLAVLLVDHAPFRQIPASALAGVRVLDTRGAWTNRPEAGVEPFVRTEPARIVA